MYNTDTPLRAELPSSKQLLRSTILAAVSALVLLVAVVLPAEYGIDPTGVGRMLRMTDMGEIKQQLAQESAADVAAASATVAPAVASVSDTAGPALLAQPTKSVATDERLVSNGTPPEVEWRDEVLFTLAPGEGREIKLNMNEGEKAQYKWVVDTGAVNFDTHGDALGKSISYEKGRGVAAHEGVLQAAFTGNHGWFWRNRGTSDVEVMLQTAGDYAAMKK